VLKPQREMFQPLLCASTAKYSTIKALPKHQTAGFGYVMELILPAPIYRHPHNVYHRVSICNL